MNEIEELKNEIQKLKETNENLEKRVYELEGKMNVLYKQYAARNREKQKNRWW